MDLLMEIVEGPGTGRQIPVVGSLVLGRDPGAADVVLEDTQVSRRHAKVGKAGDGLVVEDLESSKHRSSQIRPHSRASISEPLARRTLRSGLRQLERRGITGKAVTPFLLGKILELTGGRSLKTNIALVENNARLAAKIAKAL